MKPISEWPKTNIPGLDEIPENSAAKCLMLNPILNRLHSLIVKISNFVKLKIILAYILRIIEAYQKAKSHKSQTFKHALKVGFLSIEELLEAEVLILKLVQKQAFYSEIKQLSKNHPLDEKNRLAALDPFMNDIGLLCVGGRIRKASLLPKKNHLTNLIIEFYHLDNIHTGQNTLYAFRKKYWPINGRNQVKTLLKKCVKCFRTNPQTCFYKTSNLPAVRIQQNQVFKKVGVDYCGPFHLKLREKHNKNNFLKGYVALFISMVTKAVHIELVSDLTSESFIAALDRFCGRRGYPDHIFSDNGTNFKGAHNELNDLFKLLNSQELQEKIDSRY